MKSVSWRQLAVLLVVAFLIRLAVGWAWQSRLGEKVAMGDTESYWQLGRAIASGEPYEYGTTHARVFRTPGYPRCWRRFSADRRPLDRLVLARAEAALFGTLAVLGGLGAYAAAVRRPCGAAGRGGRYDLSWAIVLGVLILSEAPFCPLMLLQLALWVLAWRAPSAGRRMLWGFAAGLAAAAATLMRPSWLLFTPLAAAVAIVAGAIAQMCAGGRVVKRSEPHRNKAVPHWRARCARPTLHRSRSDWLAICHYVLDAPRAWAGDAALVDSECLGHRSFCSYHAPGRGQPVRRSESGRHRGEQHGFRPTLRGGGAASRKAVIGRRRESLELRLDRRMRRGCAGLGPGRSRAGRCNWPASSFCGCGTFTPMNRGFRQVGPSV